MVVKTELHTLLFKMSSFNTHLCLRLVKITWPLRQQCLERCLRSQACPPVTSPQLFFFLNFEVLKSIYSLVRSKNNLFTKIRQLYTVKTSVLWKSLYSLVCIGYQAIRIFSKDQIFLYNDTYMQLIGCPGKVYSLNVEHY
jgi:hypothetical protein